MSIDFVGLNESDAFDVSTFHDDSLKCQQSALAWKIRNDVKYGTICLNAHNLTRINRKIIYYAFTEFDEFQLIDQTF